MKMPYDMNYDMKKKTEKMYDIDVSCLIRE